MFRLISDGILLCTVFWKELLILTISGFGMGAICALVYYKKHRQSSFRFSFILTGFGIMGLFPFVLKFLNVFHPIGVFLAFGISIIALLGWSRKRIVNRNLENIIVDWCLPSFIFLFFLIIRLGYLRGLLFPPYSDSPVHFANVKLFFEEDVTSRYLVDKLLDHYYHFGFHGIVAWVSSVIGDLRPLTLAFVGQYFLAILPLSVYFWVFSETGSVLAGFASSMLAGLGWNMPAYAANWGKYPAIIGVALLPAFLDVVRMAWREADKKLLAFCLVLSGSLVWIHTRIAILFLFVTVAILFVKILKLIVRLEILWGIILFVFIVVLKTNATAWNIADYFRYYLGAFGGATYIFAILFPLAIVQHPIFALYVFLTGFLMILGTIVPLPDIFQAYSATLIDKPFFELTFFLILALLGGLGIDGLSHVLQGMIPDSVIAIFSFLFIFSNAMIFFTFYPVEKMNFVTEDDLFAMSWIEDSTSPNAVFIIAGEQFLDHWLSTDAGGWVNPLLDRKLYKLDYRFDWESEYQVRDLCDGLNDELSYFIYIGSMPRRFILPIDRIPTWLESELHFSQTQIYRLKCVY